METGFGRSTAAHRTIEVVYLSIIQAGKFQAQHLPCFATAQLGYLQSVAAVPTT